MSKWLLRVVREEEVVEICNKKLPQIHSVLQVESTLCMENWGESFNYHVIYCHI